jgi:putative transposase
VAMAKADPDREERRRQQKEIADSLKESGALDEILARIDAGEPVTGHEGLLKGMLKASLERGLDVELSDDVGYDRGDPDASMFSNSRDGTFSRTLATEIGVGELAVPCDHNGTFTPMLVPKGMRRLAGSRDDHFAVCGRDDRARHWPSSRLDDRHRTQPRDDFQDRRRRSEEVMAWQQRPLEALYPVVYLDAIIVKVRDGGHVGNKAAHSAVGVDMDGIKHVLGIWVKPPSAKFWASVCADLANRGVRDVLIVCGDPVVGPVAMRLGVG